VNTLQQQIRREWHLLLSDAWLRAIVSWIPLLLFLMMWWIFSAGLPRDLAIGIVDLDHSDISRGLIRQYDAHPSLSVSRQFSDVNSGSRAMRNGEINALLVIPYKLKAQIIAGQPPQVTAFYNSQFLLTGNIIAGALTQAHGTFGPKLEVLNAMANGNIGEQALGAAVPVATQSTALFNINTNYANFLVSALIPSLWQILIVVITMLALSREMRLQGLANWLGEKPLIAIAGKCFPYTLILWLHGIISLWFMYGLLGWPMNGSWEILLLSQLLMVLASQSVGLLLFLLVKNSARALSLAAAYTAPSFAFIGVTFPATDMTFPAQIWRDFIPVSHYIKIQLYQANHGASVLTALPQIGGLLLFSVAFLLAYQLAVQIKQRATNT